jgi:hypothetical protein
MTIFSLWPRPIRTLHTFKDIACGFHASCSPEVACDRDRAADSYMLALYHCSHITRPPKAQTCIAFEIPQANQHAFSHSNFASPTGILTNHRTPGVGHNMRIEIGVFVEDGWKVVASRRCSGGRKLMIAVSKPALLLPAAINGVKVSLQRRVLIWDLNRLGRSLSQVLPLRRFSISSCLLRAPGLPMA